MLTPQSAAPLLSQESRDTSQDADETGSQPDPGNLISPDPRRTPANPMSPRAGSEKATPLTPTPSSPLPIPSPVKSPAPIQSVAVNATAEGTGLPLIGSPEQYLLRAKHLPPRPGAKLVTKTEADVASQGDLHASKGDHTPPGKDWYAKANFISRSLRELQIQVLEESYLPCYRLYWIML